MTDPAFDRLILYRTLASGRALLRTEDRPWRLFLREPDGRVIGEVLPGSTSAQLLGLTPADWGETQTESSPEIVAGPLPVQPHAPRPRMSFAERVAAIKERWSALFRR